MKKFLRKTFMILTAFMLVLLIAGGAFAVDTPSFINWYRMVSRQKVVFGEEINVAKYDYTEEDYVLADTTAKLERDMRLLPDGSITYHTVTDTNDEDKNVAAFAITPDKQVPLKVFAGYPYSARYPFPSLELYEGSSASSTQVPDDFYTTTWKVDSKSALDGVILENNNLVYFNGVFDAVKDSKGEIHTAQINSTFTATTEGAQYYEFGKTNSLNSAKWTLETVVYPDTRPVMTPASSDFRLIIPLEGDRLMIVSSKDYSVEFDAEPRATSYQVLPWPFKKLISGDDYTPYGSSTPVEYGYFIYDGIAMPDWLKCTMSYTDEDGENAASINIAEIRSMLSYDVMLEKEDEETYIASEIIAAGYVPNDNDNDTKFHYLVGFTQDIEEDETTDTDRGITDDDETAYYPTRFKIEYNSSVPAPALGTKGKVIIPLLHTINTDNSEIVLLEYDVYYGTSVDPTPEPVVVPKIVLDFPAVPDYNPGDDLEDSAVVNKPYGLSVDVLSGTVNNITIKLASEDSWLTYVIKGKSIDITGTPAKAGRYEFDIVFSGVDENNLSASADVKLNIDVSPDAAPAPDPDPDPQPEPEVRLTLSISPRNLTVRLGATATATLSVSNASGTFTSSCNPEEEWVSISGNTINAAPTAANAEIGSHRFTITVTDTAGSTASQDITINVIEDSDPQPTPTPDSAPRPNYSTQELDNFQNALNNQRPAQITISADIDVAAWNLKIDGSTAKTAYISKLKRSVSENNWITLQRSSASQRSAIVTLVSFPTIEDGISAGVHSITVTYNPVDTTNFSESTPINLGEFVISEDEILPVYGGSSDICSLGFNGLALALVSMLFFRKR